MKFEIDTEKMARDAFTSAMEHAKQKAVSSAAYIVDELFSVKRGGRFPQAEGLGREIVRKKCEEFILSEKFETMLDDIIVREFDAQAVLAVRKLLASKTRKRLFQGSEDMPRD